MYYRIAELAEEKLLDVPQSMDVYMRAIKEGWYAVDGNGNLTFGPYSSREDCASKIGQPTE